MIETSLIRHWTIVVFLIGFMGNAQMVAVDNGYYKVEYSMEHKQPLQVSYDVNCPTKGASRKGMNFFEEDNYITSSNKDYYKNIWDKGHLAPAASFDCSLEMLYSTFSFLNCALQHQDLNRGAWKYLEMYERRLALYTSVHVIITVHFDTYLGTTPGGARIPSGFTKTLVTSDETQVFTFKNERPLFKGKDSYRQYQVKYNGKG